MPIYEYKCHGCGRKFEVRQKFSDAPVKVHEACGGEVERLISVSSLHFKGTGWYVTDYAKGKSSSLGGSNGNSESKSENKSETKSETKSDSKPAAAATKTESSPAPAKT